MHIFLDTTVLRSDFHLSSPDARLLEQFVRTTGARLAIPAVVIEEAKNKLREELENSRTELGKLSRLLHAAPQPLPTVDVDAKVLKYERHLRDRLTKSFRAVLPGFPTVSHQEIVRRDLNRRKPFHKSGTGYRDTLIWHSILGRIRSVKDEFVFITDNTRDFWNEAGQDLHDELRWDLAHLGGIVGPFRMFRNLGSFNAAIVKPKLEKIGELRTQLQKDEFPQLSVRKIAEEFEREVTDNLNFAAALRHIRREYEVSTGDAQVLDFGYVTTPDNIEVTEVLEMPNANLFIRFSAECEVSVALNVPAEQSEKWESAGFCLDSTIQGGDVLMSIDLPIRAEFSLIYDPELRQIVSHEVSAEFA